MSSGPPYLARRERVEVVRREMDSLLEDYPLDVGAESCHAYEGEEHDYYLSTACFNGRHGYCASMQGVKRAATCRFCDGRCRCSCHGGAA